MIGERFRFMEQRKLTDTLESKAEFPRIQEFIALQIELLKYSEFCRKTEEQEWNFQGKRFVTHRVKFLDTFLFTSLFVYVLDFS